MFSNSQPGPHPSFYGGDEGLSRASQEEAQASADLQPQLLRLGALDRKSTCSADSCPTPNQWLAQGQGFLGVGMMKLQKLPVRWLQNWLPFPVPAWHVGKHSWFCPQQVVEGNSVQEGLTWS